MKAPDDRASQMTDLDEGHETLVTPEKDTAKIEQIAADLTEIGTDRERLETLAESEGRAGHAQGVQSGEIGIATGMETFIVGGESTLQDSV